jgi:hypothetical protein
MGLDVDEAGREREAAGVDAFVGGFGGECVAGRDGGDAITAHADVAVVPRVAVPSTIPFDDQVRLARSAH